MSAVDFRKEIDNTTEKWEEYLFYSVTIIAIIGILVGIISNTVASYILLFLSALLVFTGLWMIRSEIGPINLLMAFVAIVTWYHGYVLEGLLVLFLFGTAEIIEHVIVKRAGDKLLELLEALPKNVTRIIDGEVEKVDVDSVAPGDIIVIATGDMVPVDGEALNPAEVDTSSITGEPYPRKIGAGTYVQSGYVVTHGPLKMKVAKSSKESYMQVLVGMAMDSLRNKTQLLSLMERITPLLAAVLVASYILSYSMFGPIRSLAIILAGCPSAFIITSSFTTSYTVSRLASNGVLVRNPVILEYLDKMDAIVMDKTGTLTKLDARLVAVNPPKGLDEETFLYKVKKVVSQSRHPVSMAVLSALSSVGIASDKDGSTTSVIEKKGVGLIASTEEGLLEIKSSDKCPNGKGVEASLNGGLAVFCIEEELVESSLQPIYEMMSKGKRLIIASGDSMENVGKIARRAGISEYYANMKPDDKLRLIEELSRKYRRIGFVGDGINDAPALARADVSIAIGSVMTSAKASDAVLPSGPHQLPLLFKASSLHWKSIKYGFITAVLIKLTVIITGLAGILNVPLMVLFGDDGSTLIAVFLAYLLLKNM
ncbi:MAG: HAD-IC family P-type ATPase [Desulfurococcales archaeon]|nr:HAD-IC family P-type ATPase [Desulfurococcales archaeon]